FGTLIARMKPTAGEPVQPGELRRFRAAQAFLEKLAEETVVTIPVALVIEPLHEEVAPLELLEQLPGVTRAAEQVPELAVDPLQDRAIKQQTSLVGIERIEHLLD